MCGIAGILSRNGDEVPRDVLRAMTRTLHHRGPDGSDVKVLGPCGLGHTRLKVIDLSEAGAQPLPNEDETVWVSFNGEIYNFLELRPELEAKGHRFRGRADTEVIVHLYEEYGVEGLSRLDGMFAFALWDHNRRVLVLARDRTGKKPLFYYDHGGVFLFASELGAILEHPEVDRSVREPVFAAYLRWGYVPTPHTAYNRIHKLPPATTMVVTPRSPPKVRRYWSFPTEVIDPSLEEAAGTVRRLFIEAVEKRMRADVPLGLFLSGGVDSTLVAAVVRRELGRDLATYSLGFAGDPRFDESAAARRVARLFGTRHTEFRVEAQSLELFEELLGHYGEPYADLSAVPTFVVSRMAKPCVTVALNGDGGDEVFAGYPRFLSTALAEHVPRRLGRMAQRLARRVGAVRHHDSRFERARRFAERLGYPLAERLASYVSVLRPEELARAWKGVVPSTPKTYADDAWDEGAPAHDVINALLRLNARSYLLDDLNVKMDRASMAASVETRSPFLDTKLLEYAFALPGRYKIYGGTTKWILKKAFADLLPDSVVRRRKMGFGPPVGAWLSGSAERYLQDGIGSRDAELYRYVRFSYVRSMREEHRAGGRDWGMQLWCLLAFQMWLRSPRSPGDLTG